ncbi:MAG: branched-chain amino acid ABC transporter permease [Rhodobacteraceae bacterium]|nr:branched-chain amino acid ABC transporter permease [Paracoccaceae bacterium]
MTTLLSILVDGIAYGMILFMISVGLSVTMGLMRVVNLAHGGFALIGGALAHALVTAGLDYWAGMALAVAGTMLIALPMEAVLYRRIYRMGELQQVLATIGITFMIIAMVNFTLGSTLLPIPTPDLLRGSLDLGFRVLPYHRIAVIVAGLSVTLLLFLLIERTRFGIRLRAAVDHRATAATLGINTARIYALTFMLGAGLAALGGVLGAELLPIEAYYPLRYMVLFLIVVAVGGMGSITGSFVAALGLGVLDTATRYLVPEFGTIVFYGTMMLILTLRPRGLMGRGRA